MTPEERALAASRVLNEPIIAETVAKLRADALEALAKIDPLSADGIRKFQAQISALDGLVGELSFAAAMLDVAKRQAVA